MEHQIYLLETFLEFCDNNAISNDCNYGTPEMKGFVLTLELAYLFFCDYYEKSNFTEEGIVYEDIVLTNTLDSLLDIRSEIKNMISYFGKMPARSSEKDELSYVIEELKHSIYYLNREIANQLKNEL